MLIRKVKFLAAFTLVFTVAALLMVGGCQQEEKAQLKVVTSTSLIAHIVERVGGDLIDVVNIIPPAQCPGHFDVKPGDIQKLADADLFLLHGWQGEMFSQELIVSANNPSLTVVQVNVMVGENVNWMTPPVQQAAVDKITETLCQIDEANCSVYRQAADKYKSIIAAKESEIKKKLSGLDLAGVNVMCADQLVGFVKWAGFNIISIYGRPETFTPQVVKDLVDRGRAEKVALIIDNLQSGQDAGAGVAEELGCKRVILTNFPGGFANTETWEKAIDYDIELLIEAMQK